MRAAIALLILSLRQAKRSRGLVACAAFFYAVLFLLNFAMSDSGPPEAGVTFYLSLAWLLLYGFTLAVSVTLPLRLFAVEREERQIHIIGVRPISRLAIIGARFATSVLVGACALAVGCLVIRAGVGLLAARRSVDLDRFAGCLVRSAPPRPVSERDVDELTQELGQDPAFLRRHGTDGVRAAARNSLSVWRLTTGEPTRITWEGMPGTARGGRIRYQASVYPPWAGVDAEFRCGWGVVKRRLRSGIPAEFPLPAGAVDADGTLSVVITCTGDTDALVTFPPPEGLAVFLPEIGFARNLLRAALLLLTVVAAVAAYGVLSGATLSFPTGLLAVVVLVVVGIGSSVFTEAVQEFTEPLEHHHGEAGIDGEGRPELLPPAVRKVWQAVMLAALEAIPNLGDVEPGRYVAEGRSIPFARVGRSAAGATVLRGGVALLVAWLLFRRQELGRRR